MSVLSNFGLYGSVGLMALLGSGHCFAMCGGLAAFAGIKRAPTYQLGRLLGYLAVGALCGSLGKGVLRIFESRPELLLGLSFAFTFVLLIQAWAWWVGEESRSRVAKVHRGIFESLFGRISRWASRRGGSFGLGLGTALLPCGWLATFALVAAGTGSPLQGATVFALLWGGSLPALFAAAFGASAFLDRSRKPAVRKAAAIGMALIAFASLSQRIQHSGFTSGHSDGAVCGR